MTSQLPDEATMREIIQRELELCSVETRNAVAPLLVELFLKTLLWEYGDCEEYQSWVFADMGERGVVAAYCLGGFGALGSPWGIVFKHDQYFGMDPGWYESLQDLLVDWGLGNQA